MQPSTPPAPPPAPLPTGHSAGSDPNKPSQYDFIMNSSNRSKQGLLGGSQTNRIIMVGAGLIVLIILIIVFYSILSGGKKNVTQSLINLAQRQNEIVRVAGLGVMNASSPSTQNFAITTELSMESSQQDTLALLQKAGHKLNSNQLAVLSNPQTDAQLSTATQNGNYDTVLTQVLHDELNSYELAVFQTYSATQSSATKQTLGISYSGVQLLLTD